MKRQRSDEGAGDGLQLRYCIFDWDDNVVHMPTRIWMEDVADGSPVPLSTAEFARRRNEPGLRPAENAFREFRDETGDFAGDLRRAMSGERWRGPAFDAFKLAVTEGRLFAVVTARGHSGETMCGAVAGFIDEILSDTDKEAMKRNLKAFNAAAARKVPDGSLVADYLGLCSFVGVSNPEFVEQTGLKATEEGKKHAIRSFVERMMEMSQDIMQNGNAIASISFGMSDDDRKNVEAVDAFMRDELSLAYARVKFVVFDTSLGTGKTRRLKPHISDPELPK